MFISKTLCFKLDSVLLTYTNVNIKNRRFESDLFQPRTIWAKKENLIPLKVLYFEQFTQHVLNIFHCSKFGQGLHSMFFK